MRNKIQRLYFPEDLGELTLSESGCFTYAGAKNPFTDTILILVDYSDDSISSRLKAKFPRVSVARESSGLLELDKSKEERPSNFANAPELVSDLSVILGSSSLLQLTFNVEVNSGGDNFDAVLIKNTSDVPFSDLTDADVQGFVCQQVGALVFKMAMEAELEVVSDSEPEQEKQQQEEQVDVEPSTYCFGFCRR